MSTRSAAVGAASGLVLLTLGAGQFLMTLDSSVMNVSMATVASDLNTPITGIQTAITMYTLVMATLMITGGKIGSNIGRRRAFAIGCVIYAIGSFITGLAQNLTTLLIGWSLLEGIGAALIMPAIVALVASNFAAKERPRAYGLIAAAGAIAVALGPLIGGAATTYFSWRLVFFSESIIVAIILLLSRRIADVPVVSKKPLDYVGTLLSVAGLGLAVYGVLRTSEWGWINPKPGGPEVLGLSPSFWLIITGSFIVWVFFQWEERVLAADKEPLVRADIFASRHLNGGLIMFFFQFLLQSGVFFIIPLFLSVVLELSAIDTGVRLMPLSISLLLAAVAIPKVWPQASPRLVVRIGVFLMLLGILALLSGIDIDSTAAVVAVPLAFLGLGMGALASQLGSVTVSAVSDERSGEVGGLQNTATNLGASLGTALAGSMLIAVLTSSLITGIQSNDQVPESVQQQAGIELASGVPFLSDTALATAMNDAGASPEVTEAVVMENQEARVQGLDAALGVLAILALVSLVFTSRIPRVQPGSSEIKPGVA
ncbi:MAG: MFS transporter [Actinomycetota bacterium]|nr:MFS transporter [Actinomycetota bacterium]